MLLLSVALVVTGSISAALAVTATPVVQVSTEDDETFDDSAHNKRLADTGAQRLLVLTLGGLLSVGGGLTAWWVSRRSKSLH